MTAHWTPEDDAHLAKLWDEDVPVKDLKVIFRRSSSGITERRARLNLKPRIHGVRWPADWVDTVKRMHGEGLPYSAIAKALGATREAVSAKCQRLGLVRSPEVTRANNVAASAAKRGTSYAPRPAPAPRPAKLGSPIKAKAPKAQPKAEEIALAPRPWITREFGECAWPVGGEGADTLSCCNATLFTYCAQHMWVRTARAA